MLEYFKTRILDELKDAVAYMTKAVEYKKHQCGWDFYVMANEELNHANRFYKMFQREEQPANITNSEYASMMKEIMDAYSDHMTKFESLKKLYKEV